MFQYMVVGIAFLLFFSNPIIEYFSPDSPRVLRAPRPPINESLLAVDSANESAPSCPPDSYSVHILSKAPIIIYIENFISLQERRDLLELSEPIFEPSTVTNDGDSTLRDATVRDSEVALLPRDGDTVRCIERRVLAFQGWRDDLWIERLRTQRYRAGQHYTHHFDWGSGAARWGRVSSFMVWVSADSLEGGGTEFPLLPKRDGKWCQWVECPDDDVGPSDEDGGGVVFKPVEGNAVYWENFVPDGSGRGWSETWHAGLPVQKGTKVGLNIWSWGRLD